MINIKYAFLRCQRCCCQAFCSVSWDQGMGVSCSQTSRIACSQASPPVSKTSLDLHVFSTLLVLVSIFGKIVGQLFVFGRIVKNHLIGTALISSWFSYGVVSCWMQRRQSGLKSGESEIWGKNWIFPSKFQKI